MKSFKGFLLTEATTTKAIRTEMAICFHWNKAKNKDISDEKALELAQISVGNWSKVNLEKEGKVGENVDISKLNQNNSTSNVNCCQISIFSGRKVALAKQQNKNVYKSNQ